MAPAAAADDTFSTPRKTLTKRAGLTTLRARVGHATGNYCPSRMIVRVEKKSIHNLLAIGLTCVLANIESRPLDERDVKKSRPHSNVSANAAGRTTGGAQFERRRFKTLIDPGG